MNIVIILIAISLAIAVMFLGVFLWALKSGQYDDTYSPSVRMLFENKSNKEVENKEIKRHSNLENHDSRKRKK